MLDSSGVSSSVVPLSAPHDGAAVNNAASPQDVTPAQTPSQNDTHLGPAATSPDVGAVIDEARPSSASTSSRQGAPEAAGSAILSPAAGGASSEHRASDVTGSVAVSKPTTRPAHFMSKKLTTVPEMAMYFPERYEYMPDCAQLFPRGSSNHSSFPRAGTTARRKSSSFSSGIAGTSTQKTSQPSRSGSGGTSSDDYWPGTEPTTEYFPHPEAVFNPTSISPTTKASHYFTPGLGRTAAGDRVCYMCLGSYGGGVEACQCWA
ncbi:hypothetical protein VTI74DRAFT_1474 [Chaetomium olivicolor]